MAEYPTFGARKVENQPTQSVASQGSGFVTPRENASRKAEWASMSKQPPTTASALGAGQAGRETYNSNAPQTRAFNPTSQEASYIKPGEYVTDRTPNYSGLTNKSIFAGYDSTETRPGYSGMTFSDSSIGATQRGLDEDIQNKGLQAGGYTMRTGNPTDERSQQFANYVGTQLDARPENIANRNWEALKSTYSDPLGNPADIAPSVSEAYDKIWGGLPARAVAPQNTSAPIPKDNGRFPKPPNGLPSLFNSFENPFGDYTRGVTPTPAAQPTPAVDALGFNSVLDEQLKEFARPSKSYFDAMQQLRMLTG